MATQALRVVELGEAQPGQRRPEQGCGGHAEHVVARPAHRVGQRRGRARPGPVHQPQRDEQQRRAEPDARIGQRVELPERGRRHQRQQGTRTDHRRRGAQRAGHHVVVQRGVAHRLGCAAGAIETAGSDTRTVSSSGAGSEVSMGWIREGIRARGAWKWRGSGQRMQGYGNDLLFGTSRDNSSARVRDFGT